jgi:cytochrome c-type biogenesis protein
MDAPPGTRGAGVRVSALVAFVAGLYSFFSPCAWPLYPAFLGQVAAGGRRLAGAALFAAGFSLVFVALGASASAAGAWLQAYRLPLRQLSGAAIVVLGLAMAGLIPGRLLGQPHRPALPTAGGPWAPLVLGAGFAFGWTPCVGPVLASILLLAGGTASLSRGTALLGAYALGFAAPFVGLAALAARGARLPRVARALPAASRAGGLVLAGLGLLVLTGTLSTLATYLRGRF